MELDESREHEFAFVAVLTDAKTLLLVLQAIDLGDFATVIFSDQGIRFTIEKDKSFQVSSFLQLDLFERFTLTSEQVMFRLNMRQLIQTLSAITGPINREKGEDGSLMPPPSVVPSINQSVAEAIISLKLMYKGVGHPLIFIFNYNGEANTICREMTQREVDLVLFDIPSEEAVSRVIVDSIFLREIWNDLDFASNTLTMGFEENVGISLGTTSPYGKAEVRIKKESSKISKFKCIGQYKYTYLMSMLKYSVKALGQSEKVSFRINCHGLLSIQYMIKLANEAKCFVEYMCLPQADI